MSRHLRLTDELRDLLAGVERCHLHMRHTPVRSTRGIQDLVMFLQDLTKTSEVQVLEEAAKKQLFYIYDRRTDWKVTTAENIKRSPARHICSHTNHSD